MKTLVRIQKNEQNNFCGECGCSCAPVMVAVKEIQKNVLQKKP